ncbi:hypothetical protein D0T49_00620 [Paludibacter sp. 221]|uniref:hypothetical protein n=1 Tax=Paludibacter sp. 221 TaxID=2302939 RepID=UPI0013D4E7E6|nr:hypothetical protein [Paludibacter sp. 221]NDV45556.1 hypothetical protein [Paludibacter sp. 221]
MNRKQLLRQAFILVCIFQFSVFIFSTKAQVTIGADASPNTNAVLDLRANYETGKYGGLLLPRVALRAVNNAYPLTAHVQGMVVYNTANAGSNENSVTPGVYYNNGSKWIRQQETTQQDNRMVVFINKTSPNVSGALFDDVPPTNEDGTPNAEFSNDDTLKAKTNYLYTATNGSIWIYNGSTYITYTQPASTAWYKSGTTIDAGTDKTGGISRSGGVGIGTSASGLNSLNVLFDTSVSTSAINYVQGARIASFSQINSNTTHYQVGASVQAFQHILSSSNTNSGYLIGQFVQTFRTEAKANLGILQSMEGNRIHFGHGGNNIGKTYYAYGISMIPYVNSGTIENIYDIYLANYVGAGTAVNKYGVVVKGTTKKSIFEGVIKLGTDGGEPGLNGVIRYNAGLKKFQGYIDGTWVNFH